MSDPYRVEQDEPMCTCCLRGATWNVIQPNGVALGVAYDDEDEAREVADMLNRAHGLALSLSSEDSKSA
jgi:hypothetical protein